MRDLAAASPTLNIAPSTMSIADLRKEYRRAALNESDVAANPIQQFDKWLTEAIAASLPEPTAMTLATVSESGRPSARIVLLKGCDPRGFLFFTNYQSHKGAELQKTPWASLVFYWIELERQVRIEGRVETASTAESDEYHTSRPRLSQLGVWASPQSKLIEDRQWLERRFADAAQRFPGEVPRPDYWGGYRLIADAIEFWQGRESRLHDRILYRLQQNGSWLIARLAP